MARPKGSKNKVGAEVREQMVACYHRLGALEGYVNWAREHQSEFYKQWASLAPKEIDATVTHRDETTLTDAELADIATGRGSGASETTSGETIDSSVH